MSDGTPIEWTDATWNVVNGCTVVSPGCAQCYAMRLAATRLRHHPSRAGLARMHGDTPQWTGEVRFNEQVLLDPLRWRRPRKIFVCAHGDLFHDKVPDEWIDRVFAVMALAPQHVFQVLTKRPERMREFLTAKLFRPRFTQAVLDQRRAWPGSWRTAPIVLNANWPLPNVWLGVSVEDQHRADERIPILLDTPAAVRWLSMEPLLGPVDLTRISRVDFGPSAHATCIKPANPMSKSLAWPVAINWVVLGGESGPGARPMHPDWARSLRDQCVTAQVPFLFKQWGDLVARAAPEARWPDGSTVPANLEPVTFQRVGKKRAGRLLDGVQHDGYPA